MSTVEIRWTPTVHSLKKRRKSWLVEEIHLMYAFLEKPSAPRRDHLARKTNEDLARMVMALYAECPE